MKACEVRGGTNVAGVDDAVFAMPAGMSVRYDRPAADLADDVTGYLVYGSVARPEGQVDWFLPSPACITITIDAGPVAVSIGRATYDPIPQACLYGPTSRALRATTHGGVMIGIGISALGWGRLFRRSAGDYRNRAVPLREVMGARFTDALVAALSGADGESAVAPLLDDILRRAMGPRHADEAHIRRLTHAIAKDGVHDIAGAAAMLAMPTHALRRMTSRHFGFPPKLLLNRARFLRSLLRFFATGEAQDYAVIDPSYFDVSHFLRDATMFLGMTPRRFLGVNRPFLEASLRARAAVLGSPAQALHEIDRMGAAEPARVVEVGA